MKWTIAMDTALGTLKALADRNRLRTVVALAGEGELCACQITELLQVSGATVSRHLAQLVRAGLLTSRQDGRWVFYRLAPGVQESPPLTWLRTDLARDPDLANDRAALQRILAEDPTVLCRRQRGEICCPPPEDSP
jgi:ArsR family transcriptional regulator